MVIHWKVVLLLLAGIAGLFVAAFFPQESATFWSGDAPANTTRTQPNIVIFMVDDLDYGLIDTLLQGGHLPTIQTYLVNGGTVFNNAFVTTALCCPSRATLLTGQYSHNHNVLDNERPTGGVTRLDDSNTVATWLQDGGYLTAYVGKYLNGYGIDASQPITSSLHPNYVPPGWGHWRALIGSSTNQVYNYKMNFNGTIVRYGKAESDYQTDVLAGLAANYIHGVEQFDSQPFFLVVAPLAPHHENDPEATTGCAADKGWWNHTIRPAPRHDGSLAALPFPQSPTFNEEVVTDKPPVITELARLTPEEIACAEIRYRDRAESMLAVEDLVLTVGKALNQSGELDNTVVIFTSDNGYYLGEHRLGGKKFGYEEGIRVPLYIRAPGYPAGQQSERYVLNNDLAPTIAAFAGVTPALGVDGRPLQPLLQDPGLTEWRHSFLVEYLGDDAGGQHSFVAVRTTEMSLNVPDMYYAQWSDGSVEYYDLALDPHQEESEHDNPDTLAARQTLEQYLNVLQTCSDAGCQQFEDSD